MQKIEGKECDIVLENYRIGIEFDGFYWHKNKNDVDKRKNELFSSCGYRLIRVREKGLLPITEDDIITTKEDVILLDDVKAVLKKVALISVLSNEEKDRYDIYQLLDNFNAEQEYERLLHILPGPVNGTSLVDLNPSLAKEWNVEKNGRLTAADVSSRSGKLVWWKCSNGHEWKESPHKRKLFGCPYCSGKRAWEEHNLLYVNPELCKEWDYTKNGDLRPEKVTPHSSKKVWWRCLQGHEWMAVVAERAYGHGCLKCSHINPLSIEEMHELAKMNEGECLSTEYKNNREKIVWKCKRGHVFYSPASQIKQGRWCYKCGRITTANKQRGNIEEYKMIADKHGGECLSTEYFNAYTKLHWRCSKGHEWDATPQCIKKGTWCPKCKGARISESKTESIEVYREIARKHGGECLTQSRNGREKISFRCENGHRWSALPGNIKSGHWCPKCARKRVNGKQVLQYDLFQ
jgi:hypothetical protein